MLKRGTSLAPEPFDQIPPIERAEVQQENTPLGYTNARWRGRKNPGEQARWRGRVQRSIGVRRRTGYGA